MIGEIGWTQLFASDTLVALLKVFFLKPEGSFYQRELADAAGARLYVVQRELARLERADLILRTPRGNRVYYQAHRTHPAFEDLKRVFLKTIILGEALRGGVAPLADRVRAAFVYGSYARGEETADSDLDLFLIGDLSPREAATTLGPLSRQLGRELNTALYSPREFRAKARAGHHFLQEVMRDRKLFLIGDEHELAALVA